MRKQIIQFGGWGLGLSYMINSCSVATEKQSELSSSSSSWACGISVIHKTDFKCQLPDSCCRALPEVFLSCFLFRSCYGLLVFVKPCDMLNFFELSL